MEKLRLHASIASAMLVGAAVVMLWPRPDVAPAVPVPKADPLPPPEQEAAEQTTSPTNAATPDPTPAAAPVLDDGLLRAHMDTARDRWEALARQAEGAEDPPTRALAPELRALAQAVPDSEPYPELQATVALLSAELGMVSKLEGSTLGADAMLEELRELERAWLGLGSASPMR